MERVASQEDAGLQAALHASRLDTGPTRSASGFLESDEKEATEASIKTYEQWRKRVADLVVAKQKGDQESFPDMLWGESKRRAPLQQAQEKLLAQMKENGLALNGASDKEALAKFLDSIEEYKEACAGQLRKCISDSHLQCKSRVVSAIVPGVNFRGCRCPCVAVDRHAV